KQLDKDPRVRGQTARAEQEPGEVRAMLRTPRRLEDFTRTSASDPQPRHRPGQSQIARPAAPQVKIKAQREFALDPARGKKVDKSPRVESPNITESREFKAPHVAGQYDPGKGASSFEDYLHDAQAELSELGAVISANEALFAAKIQEHVDGLRTAKEQLTMEYREKFDTLLEEKAKLEENLAMEREKEIRKLKMMNRRADDGKRERPGVLPTQSPESSNVPRQFGTGFLESSSPPHSPNAELRLSPTDTDAKIAEYDRRIAKRKSQMLERHAKSMQDLTAQYDTRMAQLLLDRDGLENDLSIGPAEFEEISEEMMRSVGLESERWNSEGGWGEREEGFGEDVCTGVEHAAGS
ncbi:hypothetical protein LTR39_002957, partial [Cryomyces antarcticus]